MSNYAGPGQQMQYQLPFQTSEVPSSFKSNLAPRPINSTISTSVVPAMTGTASLGGTSTIQVPLGNSAYIANPYLRFRVNIQNGANAVAGLRYKGSAQSAMSLISSYQTSINSTLVDNILNFPQVADLILSHSCSKEWLASDGAVLMATASSPGGNLGVASNGALAANALRSETYCVPMLGLLNGGGQSYPAWCQSGSLTITVNWVQSIVQALSWTAGTAADITGLTFSDVAFVYDRIAVEGDFIAKMKQDMAQSGAKFCYSFTNYQSLTQASANGSVSVNTGLNVSSLRGVVVAPVLTAVTFDTFAYPQPAGTTNLQVTLDGRLLNSSILDAVNQPAVCFIEAQKAFSRIFDSSVTDNTNRIEYRGTDAAGTDGTAKSFFLGVSACRVAEGLSFSGSPVSVIGLNFTQGAATYTNYILYISDYQLLIGADGQVDLIR